MLPDKVPLGIYAYIADQVGWEPALARGLGRQETMNADENPNWIRFETGYWKRYRMASRAAQKFDNQKNPKTIAERWALFARMDAVCADDATINPAARPAAMLSHSVGFSQIMGANHKFAGHNTIEGFWSAMKTIEGQARATVAMIRSSERLLMLGRRMNLAPRKRAQGGVYRLGDLSEISEIWNGKKYENNDHDRGLQIHIAFARRDGGRNDAAMA